MGLVLKEKICITSPQGTSEVQLLFGDITRLSLEDKVDFLFVSAFPGDYSPVPGTLIGALSRNLGLSVGQVAKDKSADLRKVFNCWVSNPLPSELPYRRLVCFERLNKGEKLTDQISGMFRAMMPVFNNENTTVITPLLAAGNQGHSESSVLSSIVSAACHWIQAGLPLRCLKIVLYKQNPHTYSDDGEKLLQFFSKLKEKWEGRKTQEVKKTEKKFDVCLSYSGKDYELVSKICDQFQKIYSVILIHKDPLKHDHEKVWQDQIFEVMIHSRKVVTVLTPHFIEEAECLEQFNLALCCNRLSGCEVLTPFYLQTVEAFPSYMLLIQYTECRVRKEGDKVEEKLLTACSMVVQEITKENSVAETALPPLASPASNKSGGRARGDSTEGQLSQPRGDKEYDIFISYAHKDPVEPQKVYENFLDIDPGLKVFLDRSELRTGNSWQETLYDAVDNAKVVIAFITQSYIQSAVCQEEFNIALARYMSMDGVYLVPLLMDQSLTEVPAMFAGAPLVNMTVASLRHEEHFYNTALAPARWLEQMKNGRRVLNKFCQPEPRKTTISFVTAKWRAWDFSLRFAFEDGRVTHLKNKTAVDASYPAKKSVLFCYAQDCFREAMLLSHLVVEQQKSVDCEFLVPPQSINVQAPRLQLLDSADIVVLFVSDDFIKSDQHMQQLHIALCRQRVVKDRRVVYFIEANHSRRKPTYSHLLPYSISMGDDLWANITRTTTQRTAVKVLMKGEAMTLHCSSAEMSALTAASLDIIDKLYSESKEGGSGMPTSIVNLVNLIKKQSEVTISVAKSLVPFSLLEKDETVADDESGTSENDVAVTDVHADDPQIINNNIRSSTKENHETEVEQGTKTTLKNSQKSIQQSDKHFGDDSELVSGVSTSMVSERKKQSSTCILL